MRAAVNDLETDPMCRRVVGSRGVASPFSRTPYPLESIRESPLYTVRPNPGTFQSLRIFLA